MYASLQSQKLTHNDYNNMIQAWLRSHCVVLHFFSICIFPAESKSALIARKNEYWFNCPDVSVLFQSCSVCKFAIFTKNTKPNKYAPSSAS